MTTQYTIPANISTVPPGPRGYPLVGILPMMMRDPLQFLCDAATNYGDLISLSVGPMRFYLLNKPEYFKHVLQEHHRNYHKGANFKTAKRLLGQGLPMNEGDSWLRQRRLAQPAFHHQRIAGLTTMITDSIGEMLPSWQEAAARGDSLDVAAEMTLLTQKIIFRTMFGSDIADQEQVCEDLSIALAQVTRGFWLSFMPDTWIPGNRQFEESLRRLDAVIYRIIDERRRSGHDAGDLVTMLLQARDADTGEGMSDKQVRDEIITIFIAGHDTTASTLAWAWHLLAQNPEVERRMAAELDTVLGGRTPTYQDLPQLVYTKMVIEEVMRLYPVAWVMFRTPPADDVIDGYRIPAGSVLMLSPYVLHRTPALWEEPNRFDPERFRPERSAGRSRFAYVPFGAGPRICIGNSLAQVEMQLIIAMIAQRYRLSGVPGHPIETKIEVILRPRYGVRMSLLPRSS